jgi:hypothetical protein
MCNVPLDSLGERRAHGHGMLFMPCSVKCLHEGSWCYPILVPRFDVIDHRDRHARRERRVVLAAAVQQIQDRIALP